LAYRDKEENVALVFTEEQLMLKDAARDFLRERAPVSHLREIRDSGNSDGFSRELWSEIAEMGWAAILVPESYGGLEYGHVGMGIVLEESGRTLTPSPLLSTAMVCTATIVKAGSEAQCSSILPAVATGESLLALACDESAHHQPDSINTEAVKHGDGFRISGSKCAVADGHIADTFIVSARSEDGVSLFLVPASAKGLSVEPYRVLDTHFAARLVLDGVELDKDSLLGEPGQGQALLEHALDVGRIGASAELLGIAQEVFEQTMEYLKERKQFGVAIGSFQALQHRAAQLFGEIEMCKSLVIKALQTLDENDGSHAELASLCKAKLSETAHLATTEAIQMHGGIGMTDEFDIGFFLKRCQVLETLYGDAYYHLDRFARERGY
jgi:alkylation response protein AidB-like acyl-CoA dehydrogenase